MTSGHHIGLEYRDFRVCVESLQPSHLAWLAEFLAPHFRPVDAERCGCRVRLIADTDRYERLHASGPAPGGAVRDCFALDSTVIRLPIWNGLEGDPTVFDAPFRVFYSVRAGNPPTISLLTPDGPGAVRVPLMRVVRELAMNHADRTGGIFLHASAVAIGGEGVIITGHKASGKTTLLLHLLREDDATYLANDRVLIVPGSPSVLCGMPSIVTIRPPTLQRFPALHARLLESRYAPRLSIAETEADDAPPVRAWNDGRYGISPPQFCRLIPTRQVSECHASVLLFPTITHVAGGIRLVPLRPRDAVERLEQSLFGMTTWKKRDELFELGADATATSLSSRCDQFARTVGAFECQLGLDAYDDLRSPAVLLAEARREASVYS